MNLLLFLRQVAIPTHFSACKITNFLRHTQPLTHFFSSLASHPPPKRKKSSPFTTSPSIYQVKQFSRNYLRRLAAAGAAEGTMRLLRSFANSYGEEIGVMLSS